MIFLDSNIPMYLIGADHPHKAAARVALDRLIADGLRLVTDAGVYQEILHRYVALNRHVDIQPAFDVLDGITDAVLPIEHEDVRAAKALVTAQPALSARDAVHVAVMRRAGLSSILSFDHGFDTVNGIERLPA